jgi:hypothetical protein
MYTLYYAGFPSDEEKCRYGHLKRLAYKIGGVPPESAGGFSVVVKQLKRLSEEALRMPEDVIEDMNGP